ncbi:MAG: HEAT repeat domain-containing protein, partial [Actinomycetota bacterium]
MSAGDRTASTAQHAPSPLLRALKIRPGEGGVAGLVIAMMFVVWSGFAIGGNAIEGLLFARYGPDALPYLFVALGVGTAAVMLGLNSVLQRPDPQRFLVRLLPAMAVVVVGMRALLLLHARWLYPVLWLAMMVLWTAIGVVIWGVAGAVNDTRQGKRLFPLYGSALILGGVVGGVATAPLATSLGAENLLFLWAASFAAAFVLAASALRRAGVRVAGHRRAGRSSASVRDRLAEGLRSVRSSRLLSLMAVSLALLAILYFSLTFVFARAATARFPEADQLTGFLGLFMGLTSAAALVVALFLANRMYARFGLATMVVALAVLYAAGFSVTLVSTGFVTLFVFRFVQAVWVNGVWSGAWQSLYSVVPPERRDGTRAFIDGVAIQAGVALAGLMLILADRVLGARAVAVIGLGTAIVAVVLTWRLRGAYAGAVVEALRAGNPEVFVVEEEPFGGIRRDAAAIDAVTEAASDADPVMRRVSMEILRDLDTTDAREALIEGLGDDDAGVRATAALALAVRGTEVPPGPVVSLLGDADPAVRSAAVSLASAEASPSLARLLSDSDPATRAGAAAELARFGTNGAGASTLREMASSSDPEERLAAIAHGPVTTDDLAAPISDEDPRVRRAAVARAGELPPAEAAAHLVPLLGDPDRGVRSAAVDALAGFGNAVSDAVEIARENPGLEDAATWVLARSGAGDPGMLNAFVDRRVAEAVRYLSLLRAVSRRDDAEADLLALCLRNRALARSVSALRASQRFDPSAVELAIADLTSPEPSRRANALEALDAMGDPHVRPLAQAWESATSRSGDLAHALGEILEDEDAWVRASGALVAADDPELRDRVEVLAAGDDDTLVRTAAEVGLREANVQTLTTLSLIERIVFLRRVPLFDGLSPEDLKHVADITGEHAYAEGDLIAEQGETGDEMHLIVSGEIGVRVGPDPTAAREVARRGAGESVGEMAVISRAPRMASL